jgi:hypothetical protein
MVTIIIKSKLSKHKRQSLPLDGFNELKIHICNDSQGILI